MGWVMMSERELNRVEILAHSLQHDQAAQRSGLPPTRAGKHRTNGPETDDALTIKPHHPMGAR